MAGRGAESLPPKNGNVNPRMFVTAILLLALPLLAAACGGGSDSKKIAKIEAKEMVAACGDNIMNAEDYTPKVAHPCRAGELRHLTGTLWRMRVEMPYPPPTSSFCVTFDAASYTPGREVMKKNGESCS